MAKRKRYEYTAFLGEGRPCETARGALGKGFVVTKARLARATGQPCTVYRRTLEGYGGSSVWERTKL
jgi:hypothetical protein